MPAVHATRPLLRVTRPDPRRLSLHTVACGTFDEVVALATSGALKHGDLIVGLDPARPLPAHVVPELTLLVPGPFEAEAWQRFRIGLAFTAFVEVCLFAVLIGSGGISTYVNWLHELPLLAVAPVYALLPPILSGWDWRRRVNARVRRQRAEAGAH